MFAPSVTQAEKLIKLMLVVTVLLFLPILAIGQQHEETIVRILELGKPVEQPLRGGEEHSYQITLDSGHYLKVVVDQRGVDIVLTLFGPDGKPVIEVDSPNGTQGPEPLIALIETAGRYKLSIRSLEREAPLGKYEAKLIELRLATQNDRDLNDAARKLAEAGQLRGQGKSEAALPLAESALTIREKILGPDHEDVAVAVKDVGSLYFENGNYSKAEPLFQRVLALREKSPGPAQLDLAQAQNDLAELHLARGDFAKAEPLFQRSLAIREKALGPEHPHVATSLNNLGGVYYEQGLYAKVEPLWERALVIVEKTQGPLHTDVADALHSLATLYYSKSDDIKAEPMYLRSLAIREKALGPEHPGLSVTLNNLAALYSRRGDHAKSEPLYQRSLAIREKAFGPNHPAVAAALGSLASYYFDVRDFAKEEPLLLRALPIWQKALGPDHPQVSIVLNALGLLYYANGDHEKVEPLWRVSLEIREKALGPDHPDVAKALNNLAFLYSDWGETAKAEPLFLRALAIREKTFGPMHPDVAEAYNSLAFLYMAKGDAARAIDARTRCTEILEYNLAFNLATGSERQKLLYLATLSGETDSTISLHQQNAPNNPVAARLALLTILRRKGRGLDAMTDQIGAIRRRANPQDRLVLDLLSEVRAQLAAIVLRGPGRTGAARHQEDITRLEGQLDKLEAEISLRSAEFRAGAQPVTLEAIQPLIPRDATLIEFFSHRPFNPKHKNLAERFGSRRYVAYVLQAQGDPLWVDLGEAMPIDSAIKSFRASLRDRQRKDTRKIARTLDEIIMRPLRKLIGGSRHMLLSPDGELNLIPFGALVDERNRYLIETYSIAYLTSGRDLLRLKTSAKERQEPLILADPAFDGNELAGERVKSSDETAGAMRSVDFSNMRFVRLPGTADEARALSAILRDGKLLVGTQATEEALKKVSGARVLHVATHGFFLADQAPTSLTKSEVGPTSMFAPRTDMARIENPLLRSGLVLTGANQRQGGSGEDGILTALEAAGLDLWGTKLVVLSACETGVGTVRNGEGVYGLRRALVLAGAESQVMTLWQVADTATRDLMTTYYTHLRAGQGRGQALRKAQLGMLRSKNRKHPFYWASFIHSGAWTSIDEVKR